MDVYTLEAVYVGHYVVLTVLEEVLYLWKLAMLLHLCSIGGYHKSDQDDLVWLFLCRSVRFLCWHCHSMIVDALTDETSVTYSRRRIVVPFPLLYRMGGRSGRTTAAGELTSVSIAWREQSSTAFLRAASRAREDSTVVELLTRTGEDTERRGTILSLAQRSNA